MADMNNNINAIALVVGAILVIVVAVQSYFIYDLKSSINRSSQFSTIVENEKKNVKSKDIDLFQAFDDQFEPFYEIQAMQNEMDRIFSNFNSHFFSTPLFSNNFKNLQRSPLSDIEDKGDKYVVSMNIPGVDINNIQIETQGNYMNVSATISSENTNQDSTFLRRERFFSKFKKSLTLPDDADTTDISHSYKDGVLKIDIKKSS